MGKFDGILFITDLDGTLIQSDRNISEENADAIRYFQSEGGIFTVATGRYPDFLGNYADKFKVNGIVVGLNGNLIYDVYEDKTHYVSRMDMHKLQTVLDDMTKTYPDEFIFIDVNDDTESYRYEGFFYRDACKVIFVTEKEENALRLKKAFSEKYGHLYKFERSWDVGLEFYDINSGKGECIDYIRKHIYPDIKKIICAGDYENDVGMLKRADIGFAVKNGAPDALKAADRITEVDNDHHAIAWIINELEKEVL